MIEKEKIEQKADGVWNEFMETPIDFDDIKEMALDRSTPKFFRFRALEICLAPNVNELGFKVNVDSDEAKNYCCKMEVEEIAKLIGSHPCDEQLIFLTKKIPEYIKKVDSLIEEGKDNPENEDWVSLRRFYNNLIPVLLRNNYRSNGEKLFECFNVNKFNPDHSNSWRFRPARNIFMDEEMDDHWKFETAGKVHQVIEERFINGLGSAVEFNQAVDNYSKIVADGQLPNLLFSEEINYLLKIRKEGFVVPFDRTKEAYYKIAFEGIKRDFLKRQIESYKKSGMSSLFFKKTDQEFVDRLWDDFGDDDEVWQQISELWEETGKIIDKQRFDFSNWDIFNNKRKKEIEDIKKRMKQIRFPAE